MNDEIAIKVNGKNKIPKNLIPGISFL